MVRFVTTLLAVAAVTNAVRADIPPPPPPMGKKYVSVNHEVVLGKDVTGYVFVEVDLIARRAVGARLGVGQSREDPRRRLSDRGAERAPLDDRQNVAERAVARVRAVVDLHVHLGRAERSLPHLARHELPPLEGELLELTPEGVERRTRIDQRAENHVPRRPARTIKIRDPHTRELQRHARPAGSGGLPRAGLILPRVGAALRDP